MNAKIKPIILACSLSLIAAPAMATDIYLIAKPFTKQLPMSGQTDVTVPMWGYALDQGGTCYGQLSSADRMNPNTTACAGPQATAPGPEITIPPGDTELRIFLTNLLPTSTSVVVTGQEMPVSPVHGTTPNRMGPTWNDGTTGNRTSPDQKVRSYGLEAPPNGGLMDYVWTLGDIPLGRRGPILHVENAIENEGGTFIYSSGTDPQLQDYMGLYGAVVKSSAAGEIYPGVPYEGEQILFYSDIDPAHNAAVAAGDPNYTPIDYNARWFLVNGEPYTVGSAALALGNAGAPNLLRFLSAASEKHVPVIQGMHGTIHAEDGIPYTWQNGATGEVWPAPVQQYSIDLPPLKTKDVIVSAPAGGNYAVYDGNGYMTNPSDPENPDVGDAIGGMLAFLSFGAALPVGMADEIVITFPAGGTGNPGTVNVLANDSNPEGGSLSVVAYDTTTPTIGGTIVCDFIGDCTFTPDAYVAGTDSFTYSISNGTNQVDAIPVNVTLVENQPPVPVDDPDIVTDTDVPVNFNVLANDTDAEGDPLQIVTLNMTGIVEGVVDCPDLATGDCSYTPPVTASAYPLVETFTYTLTDGVTLETTAVGTVTVTVNGPTVILEAVADSYTTPQDTLLSVDSISGVVANDNPNSGVTAELAIGGAPLNAQTFTLNLDGSFSYTPAAGYQGDDSFSYHLSDGSNVSNDVTVTISVTAP